MEETKQQDEIALEVGDKKLRVRGSDMLGILTLVVVILLAYLYWEHRLDAKEVGKELTGAIKEMTSAQRQSTLAQREMNCLISLPQDRRENELVSTNSFCKRMARE